MIFVGIAMIGLLQSAFLYGMIYFTLGKSLKLDKRAMGSGFAALLVLTAIIGVEAFETDISPIRDHKTLSWFATSALGLILWTWRTHLSDQIELRKSPPDRSSGL